MKKTNACPDFDKPGSLLQRTKELLAKRRLERPFAYYEISLATGLNQHWLKSVASGNVSEPSVNRVQCLYEHLSGLTLSVQ